MKWCDRALTISAPFRASKSSWIWVQTVSIEGLSSCDTNQDVCRTCFVNGGQLLRMCGRLPPFTTLVTNSCPFCANRNAGFKARISYSKIPKENTSHFSLYGVLRTTSGAMYGKEPHWPVKLYWRAWRDTLSSGAKYFASPKSKTLTCPRTSNPMF